MAKARCERNAVPARDLPPLHVVLDLDLTLISSDQSLPPGKDAFRLRAVPPDMPTRLWVQKRPGADGFLRWLSTQPVEVSVFTSSNELYAAQVVHHLDPSRAVIKRLLSRRRCRRDPATSAYVKDLTAFGSRDLRRTVLVDNDLRVFKPQPDNGIHVADWLGDGADEELLRVRGLLEELMHVPDVRPLLRSKLDLAPRVRECYPKPAGPAALFQTSAWTSLALTLRLLVAFLSMVPVVQAKVVDQRDAMATEHSTH